MYGPTTGDRIRLGDTCLWVEVEADDGTPGDELLGGCGKTVRDGLLASRSDRDSALDMVVAGVVLMDPVLGCARPTSASRTAVSSPSGRVGSPDVMDVEYAIDSHTSSGAGRRADRDTRHRRQPRPPLLARSGAAALSAGVTTLVGMGLGGVWEIGCNPPTTCTPDERLAGHPAQHRLPGPGFVEFAGAARRGRPSPGPAASRSTRTSGRRPASSTTASTRPSRPTFRWPCTPTP
ncbi:hypothetical protein [Streptomyces sp. KL116D]|uniref:hypothetical protein n=1 Tax=Streptomyces sp. KL116D TaxID=3045152 RepID=UPI003557C1E0